MKAFLFLAIFTFYITNEANALWQDNIFDWNLTNSVIQEKSENVIISPFSIKLILSLLSHASVLETKRELQNTLFPYREEKDIPLYFINALRNLKPVGTNFVLDIITSIFIDQNKVQEPRQQFLEGAKHYYNSDISKVDFSDDKLNETVNYLNELFENRTHGHIKDVLTEDDLAYALVLLTNAIYFQGTWENIFNDEYNIVDSFHINNNESIQVTFMTQTNYYKTVYQGYNFSMIELPYKDSAISMHIILPKFNHTIDEIMNKLDAKTFEEVKSQYYDDDTEIYLPKFNFTFKTQLKENLEALGIKKIFTNNAEIIEFKSADLKLKNVIHKAGIEVNEKGTTASAVSVAVLINRIPPPTINVNRPFAFLIEDRTTKTILFAGKVLNPLE